MLRTLHSLPSEPSPVVSKNTVFFTSIGMLMSYLRLFPQNGHLPSFECMYCRKQRLQVLAFGGGCFALGVWQILVGMLILPPLLLRQPACLAVRAARLFVRRRTLVHRAPAVDADVTIRALGWWDVYAE